MRLFEIWAILSGFAEIQCMFDKIQCAILSNADEVNPVQDALGPILFAIRAIQDATNFIRSANTSNQSFVPLYD